MVVLGLHSRFADVITQIGSQLSPQLAQAALFHQEVKAANPGATISFTGHSLSGGIAAVPCLSFA